MYVFTDQFFSHSNILLIKELDCPLTDVRVEFFDGC